MNGKEAWHKLFAIIAFIITAVAYLIAKQHYILASSIITVIIVLWGLGTFVFNKQIATPAFQHEILRYLAQNNNEATVVEIINHFHHASGRHDKTTTADITHYTIDKLIQKNMVVSDRGRVRRVT
ncbi:MAG: hypothetical protein D3922_02945 [Candidatus Electrothrix sp. AR1]|nr:hypothetical protein [Candidatus Electrothrix sp. AR1]